MSSKQLIQEVAEKTGLSQTKVKEVLDAVGDTTTKLLCCSDKDVTLPGIGKLKTAARAARVGRNPATGGQVDIPARTVVKFTALKGLKDAVA